LPPDAKEKLDSFYAALAQHYLDTYDEGAIIGIDIGNSQVVYGVRADEPEAHPFIVDVDPPDETYGKATTKREKRMRISRSSVHSTDSSALYVNPRKNLVAESDSKRHAATFSNY